MPLRRRRSEPDVWRFGQAPVCKRRHACHKHQPECHKRTHVERKRCTPAADPLIIIIIIIIIIKFVVHQGHVIKVCTKFERIRAIRG